MMNQVCVLDNGSTMPVRVWNGQRVVTFSMIDKVHERPEGTAGRNFSMNKRHFRKGVDYETLKGEDFRRFVTENFGAGYVHRGRPVINVFTETGYLMLVKTMIDDLSWDIQRMLVKNYFNEKHMPTLVDEVADKWKELLGALHDQILIESNSRAEAMIQPLYEDIKKKDADITTLRNNMVMMRNQLKLLKKASKENAQMEITKIPPSKVTRDDLTAAAVAAKYGWFTRAHNPHAFFVCALRKEAGIYVNTAEAIDTDLVKYAPSRTSPYDGQQTILAFFTPKAQQMIKDTWDRLHGERFDFTTYKLNSYGHKKGDYKTAFYKFNGKKYTVYDAHEHLITEQPEEADLFAKA